MQGAPGRAPLPLTVCCEAQAFTTKFTTTTTACMHPFILASTPARVPIHAVEHDFRLEKALPQLHVSDSEQLLTTGLLNATLAVSYGKDAARCYVLQKRVRHSSLRSPQMRTSADNAWFAQ